MTNPNPFNDFVFINATPSERGSFTLATEKALAKLEKFQLPDPSHFILQWIQALVASGAGRIDVTYSTTSLSSQFELNILFDGPGYSRVEIDSLYDHVFRSGRDRSVDRLRELALGWLSACSLNISKMLLESNGRRRIREISGGVMNETTSSTLNPDSQEEDSLDSRQHRLQILGKGHHEFQELVTRRCQEVPIALHFNTNLVSSGINRGGVPWPNRPFQCGSTKGVMGATYGGSATSHVSILRYGVEFVSRPEPSLQPPVIIRVSDSTLSKNVSQTDVVRDEAYEEFLARIRAEMKRMGLQLTSKRIPSYQRDSLNRFIQSYLVSYVDVRVFEDPERLKLMGEEFSDLINFPMFCVAGGGFISLVGLHEEYKKSGFLLYSLDERSKLARWHGTLLILEIEEVSVLRKYFSNLSALSWNEVRSLCQGLNESVLMDARRRPVVYQYLLPLESGQTKKEVKVIVPDLYPTGKTVVTKPGETQGSELPTAGVTLIVENSSGQLSSTNDLANLQRGLATAVEASLKYLCRLLRSAEISSNQSRMRYAELACEQITFLLAKRAPDRDSLEGYLSSFHDSVKSAPMIGLEDGTLVSIQDLVAYLGETGSVIWGGAFVEGLESGALDPMPCAELLLTQLLHPGQVVRTDSIRSRLQTDPDLKFRVRRQTVMRGLGSHPNPGQALKNFASEAAAQAEELQRLEREYKAALEGPKLFVKPDDERLKELEEQAEASEFVPFSLSSESSQANESNSVAQGSPSEAAKSEQPPVLPSLEQDLALLRHQLGDFCSAPGAIHVERREKQFSVHVSTKWVKEARGKVYVLRGQEPPQTLTHSLQVEGLIRICPSFRGSTPELLEEAVEQLVLKSLHCLRAEPKNPQQRRRLREWALDCCKLLPGWRKTNSNIARELTSLPLVPCAGRRFLSWRQLYKQAIRLGHTAVLGPKESDEVGDPVCDVLAFQANWRDQILEELAFPRTVTWSNKVAREQDFDTLMRNAWKEMANVVSGADADLLSHDVVGELSGEASFFTKWRAGFLSWDTNAERALVNPEHKLGKKLLKKYQPDPRWAAVFASALFSTVNRGLESVEDHHEKAFLEGLLDTLE